MPLRILFFYISFMMLNDYVIAMQGEENKFICKEPHIDNPSITCDVPFSAAKNLERHLKTVHEYSQEKAKEITIKQRQIVKIESFPCPECDIFLSDAKGLKKHLKTVHDYSEEDITNVIGYKSKKLDYTCSHCKLSCQTAKELSNHLSSEHTFSEEDILKEIKKICPSYHKNKITRPKEFVCPDNCKWEFKTTSSSSFLAHLEGKKRHNYSHEDAVKTLQKIYPAYNPNSNANKKTRNTKSIEYKCECGQTTSYLKTFQDHIKSSKHNFTEEKQLILIRKFNPHYKPKHSKEIEKVNQINNNNKRKISVNNDPVKNKRTKMGDTKEPPKKPIKTKEKKAIVYVCKEHNFSCSAIGDFKKHFKRSKHGITDDREILKFVRKFNLTYFSRKRKKKQSVNEINEIIDTDYIIVDNDICEIPNNAELLQLKDGDDSLLNYSNHINNVINIPDFNQDIQDNNDDMELQILVRPLRKEKPQKMFSINAELYLALKAPNHSIDTIAKLLERGADPNYCHMQGTTALHFECDSEFPSIDIIKLFIQYNANINASNTDGDTPLHLLCDKPHPSMEILKCLLENPNINAQSKDKDGDTLLHRFFAASFTESISSIKVCPPKSHVILDVDKDNEPGDSLTKETFAYLLKHCNVQEKNNRGDTILHWAFSRQPFHLDLVNLLLDSKADINATNNYGCGVFHHLYCLSPEGFKLYEYILEKKGDINAKNNAKDTVLHWACMEEKPSIDLIRFLIDNGAKKNIKNNANKTPFGYLSNSFKKQLNK